MRKGCAGQVQIAILPQFLAIESHFVRKGCAGQVEIAILPQFLAGGLEPRGPFGAMAQECATSDGEPKDNSWWTFATVVFVICMVTLFSTIHDGRSWA